MKTRLVHPNIQSSIKNKEGQNEDKIHRLLAVIPFHNKGSHPFSKGHSNEVAKNTLTKCKEKLPLQNNCANFNQAKYKVCLGEGIEVCPMKGPCFFPSDDDNIKVRYFLLLCKLQFTSPIPCYYQEIGLTGKFTLKLRCAIGQTTVLIIRPQNTNVHIFLYFNQSGLSAEWIM